jgi:hypothetical protein
MMTRFGKGNKAAKGGKRTGFGRPGRPREEAFFKSALCKALDREVDRALDREIEKHAVQIAQRYIARALGPKGDEFLMHAIDRLLPAA